MTDQKMLVEALKVFMERSVAPVLDQGHAALNQWRYLSCILSNEPIDLAQLDFYLLMASKGSNDSSSGTRTTSSVQKANYKAAHSPIGKFGRFAVTEMHSPPRSKGLFAGESQKRQLLGNMINFQSKMIKNQQKLQNWSKRQPEASIQLSISSNATYARSRKLM